MLKELGMPSPASAVALTIAGSDPSGGAGIQADLKTFHQFGVYGEAAITLLTVQNTQAVSRVEVMPADLVREQINAVVSDIPPRAAKTGALGNAAVIQEVARLAAHFSFPLIVDPVMISKHGAPLMEADAIRVFKQHLLPRAYLLTPNIPEAEALTGMRVQSDEELEGAARYLCNLGCRAVLIKGGHRRGDATDILVDDDGVLVLTGKRIHTEHTHGTGCTYAAAITACLALGHELRRAVEISHAFVARAIETAPGLGHGSGPVNHFASL